MIIAKNIKRANRSFQCVNSFGKGMRSEAKDKFTEKTKKGRWIKHWRISPNIVKFVGSIVGTQVEKLRGCYSSTKPTWMFQQILQVRSVGS